ncbi:MAG TPA: hypothetical protein VEK08_20425 [Planctomycetota bacterium]|nr:hypothetical protein [Planctomycetota bacterium]
MKKYIHSVLSTFALFTSALFAADGAPKSCCAEGAACCAKEKSACCIKEDCCKNHGKEDQLDCCKKDMACCAGVKEKK